MPTKLPNADPSGTRPATRAAMRPSLNRKRRAPLAARRPPDRGNRGRGREPRPAGRHGGRAGADEGRHEARGRRREGRHAGEEEAVDLEEQVAAEAEDEREHEDPWALLLDHPPDEQ